MKKEQYLSPFTRVVAMFESRDLVCTSIDQKTLVKVDPFTEEYYGKEGNDDYLIKL